MPKDKDKDSNKAKKYEAVLQALSQAQTSGDKFQIRIWTDVLLALENRDRKLKGK